jgi:hypothetical protein
MALDAGCLSQSGAWYQKVDLKTGEVLDKKYRAKQLSTSEVWSPILQSETFVNYLADRYAISSGDIMPDAEVLETLLESTDD